MAAFPERRVLRMLKGPMSRLLQRFLRPHARLLAYAIALIILSRLCGLVGPACLGHVLNEFTTRQGVPDLLLLTTVLVAALALEIRSSQLGSRKLAAVSNEVGSSIRSSLQDHVLHLPASFFDSERLGTLVSTVIGDTQQLQSILGETIAARVVKLFESLLGLTYLFFLSPLLASAGALLIAIGVLWTARGSRKVISLSRRQKTEASNCAALSTDLVNGIRTIKGHTAEAHHAGLFTVASRQLARTSIRLHEAVTAAYGQGSFFVGLTVPVTIGLGTRLVLRHELAVGSFVAYTVVLWRILWPFMDLLALSTDLAAGYAGVERIDALFRKPVDTGEGQGRIQCPASLRGRLTLQDVSFTYGDRPTLHGLTCTFEPGTINALVGASGAGKSTVLSLLAGFYQPTSGSICVDGRPLSSLDMPSYRRRLAYVHQNSFIFPGSIRDNILIADPHASEERLRTACRSAGIDPFLDDLPLLSSRDMGEQGARFSGGQRQRIAIARALLQDPTILLLDEATANLDLQADTCIQRALVE
ncbi:MAG TPA: ABC transporter ATP-binding protein, partial [Acidobacteriaceae bacterium]|nr:ABC transporter ATP-binding protein [Acidobacteriaceae bacterium]